MNTINSFLIQPIFKRLPFTTKQNSTKGINSSNNAGVVSQKLTSDVLFVNMNRYGRNEPYANKMIDAIYKISDLIKDKKDFYTVLLISQEKVKEAYNKSTLQDKIEKKVEINPYCMVKKGRGGEYFDKYVEKCKEANSARLYSPKPSKKYKNANVCQMHSIGKTVYIYEGWGDKPSSNLKLAQKAYAELLKKRHPSDKDIIEAAATIHWLIAQEAPFERGNESISNLITKSIFYAYNIKISPLKSGISTDFEAWYRDLDEYIKLYPKMFKIKPHRILNLHA